MNRYEHLKVTTDNSPHGVVIGANKISASKVGMCGAEGVWKAEYKGCEPNGGLLTKKSKSLLAGTSFAWEFPSASAAPPEAGQASQAP